ncbi:MAG: response regulator [Ignavibacteriae bacterium]|nr:response regulator [Ignavibacteria bacterium]MBI3365255.1 response regulator [Ignavibacteriota bacterium]
MPETHSILYVDDEPALRMLVQDQLVAEQYAVDTADDGDTAIETLKKKSYDIILLDMRMPRVGGIEVLKHIRERKIKSRVIVLTAVDDLAVAIEAVKNGASDYLTKPYDLNTLIGAIRRVMAR